jgi:UDP-N-acetylmuramoylalanine-D-glutamate ligase
MASMTQKTYEACEPQHLAFLGLGVMGFHMAGHLAQAGHHVTVYNRNAATAKAWLEQFKGVAAATPRRGGSYAFKLLKPSFRRGSVAVVNRNMVASLGKMSCHVKTHHTQA